MSAAPNKTVIVVAMEREIAAQVKGWKRSEHDVQGRKIIFWESDAAVAVCAGIGTRAARVATDFAVRNCGAGVSCIISAGLAGALISALRVGDIVIPKTIIDAVDGLRHVANEGSGTAFGTLVTASEVASVESKRHLAASFAADIVDMEAYAVADVAKICGIPFMAVKSVSDELGFSMPPFGRFIDDNGEMKTVAVAVYATLRPWMWKRFIALGVNSVRATERLNARLRAILDGPS